MDCLIGECSRVSTFKILRFADSTLHLTPTIWCSWDTDTDPSPSFSFFFWNETKKPKKFFCSEWQIIQRLIRDLRTRIWTKTVFFVSAAERYRSFPGQDKLELVLENCLLKIIIFVSIYKMLNGWPYIKNLSFFIVFCIF